MLGAGVDDLCLDPSCDLLFDAVAFGAALGVWIELLPGMHVSSSPATIPDGLDLRVVQASRPMSERSSAVVRLVKHLKRLLLRWLTFPDPPLRSHSHLWTDCATDFNRQISFCSKPSHIDVADAPTLLGLATYHLRPSHPKRGLPSSPPSHSTHPRAVHTI